MVLIELQGSLDVVEGEKQAGFIGTLVMDHVLLELYWPCRLSSTHISVVGQAFPQDRTSSTRGQSGHLTQASCCTQVKKVQWRKRWSDMLSGDNNREEKVTILKKTCTNSYQGHVIYSSLLEKDTV